MKKEQGITLTSLVIYIIVMLMMIVVMTSVSANFYKNNEKLSKDTVDMIEYNNFSHYFLSEIKAANNAVDQISNDGSYIVFKSGNSFSFSNNKVYYNTVEVANDVQVAHFSFYTDTQGKEHKDILVVKMEFNNYKNYQDGQDGMHYKVEEIY